MKMVTSQVKCSLMEMFLYENIVCNAVQCFPMFDTCMYQKIYFNFGPSSSLFECCTTTMERILLKAATKRYKAPGHFEND